MSNTNEPRFNEDDLVARLVADPGDVPVVQTLAGFMGKSDRPGFVRLYLTPQLDEYVECRTTDVLHVEKLGAGGGALAGTMIWLDRQATVQRTRPTAYTAQGEFLQGDIADEFMTSARMAGGFESELALWTIVIRISRRICPRPSWRGPCSVPSICNRCLPA